MQAMWSIRERDSMDLGAVHLGMGYFLTEWKSLNSVVICFPGSSAGKEPACNAGDPGLIPGLQRSSRERIGYPLQHSWSSVVTQDGKESTCNVGALGSIPGLGRFPEGEHGNPLQ